MRKDIDLDETTLSFREIIEDLSPGDELTVTAKGLEIAKITRQNARRINGNRIPSLCKGMIVIPEGDEDDKDHLEHFQDYM